MPHRTMTLPGVPYEPHCHRGGHLVALWRGRAATCTVLGVLAGWLGGCAGADAVQPVSRKKRGKGTSDRDGDAFVALPWVVLDSAAFQSLSHPARSLLLEVARQYGRSNNGKLLCSAAYLSKRGWNSAGVIHRALRDLIDRGLLHMTVQGHRPNKASWFALTWYAIDHLPGYDIGALETFPRSAYRFWQPPPKNACLSPSEAVARPAIAPSPRVEHPSLTPSEGAIKAPNGTPPTPSERHHLDMPSPAATESGVLAAQAIKQTVQTPQALTAAQKAGPGLAKGSAGQLAGKTQDGQAVVVEDRLKTAPTLAQAGISKDLSSRAQKLAAAKAAEQNARQPKRPKPALPPAIVARADGCTVERDAALPADW